VIDPLARVTGRRGHFRMESGYHADLWLDLDGLFVEPRAIAPAVAALAARLQSYDVAVVCGPLLGGAFLAQLLAHAMNADFVFAERVASSPTAGLYGARYRIPEGVAAHLPGRRVALVDDVMSAGSSLRATHAALTVGGAVPVVVAAFAVLGSRGSDFFAAQDLPVETLSHQPLDTWPQDDCPLCRAGVPLEDVAI